MTVVAKTPERVKGGRAEKRKSGRAKEQKGGRAEGRKGGRAEGPGEVSKAKTQLGLVRRL